MEETHFWGMVKFMDPWWKLSRVSHVSDDFLDWKYQLFFR